MAQPLYEKQSAKMHLSIARRQMRLCKQDLKKVYSLNEQIDEIMRTQLMMEQILADPELDKIELSAKSDVAKFQNSSENSNIGLTFYINGALSESNKTQIERFAEVNHSID